jgi:alkaline phosphatase D
VPDEVAFELADNAGFTGARRVGPVATTGRLGAAHIWFEGLEPDTLYFWRPKAGDIGGPVAGFRTPPAPGRPVRFVFSSCTTGRVAAYPSFRTALGLKPAFYLHAGDWGYADFNSIARRADHFQTRWTRLLRIPEVAGLLDATPLMFWQDDHDYYSDNGWSKTIPAFAVEAFDEMHANPTSEYFDVRWGDVHAWCLDCRLYATNPKGIDGPGKSRLGAEQKAWLIDGMRTSDAPVRIVASAMAFRNKIDDDPGWHNKYTYERDELLSFFSDLDATVLILSGDSHGQRLIHHFEFGELYEVTSSGTDFPGHSGQGNNDPEHTLVNIDDSNGIAFVELDAAGPGRELTVRCIASESGEVLFEKSLPVSA